MRPTGVTDTQQQQQQQQQQECYKVVEPANMQQHDMTHLG
jgi:hypothetical protein